jgi:hypothetical protein
MSWKQTVSAANSRFKELAKTTDSEDTIDAIDHGFNLIETIYELARRYESTRFRIPLVGWECSVSRERIL